MFDRRLGMNERMIAFLAALVVALYGLFLFLPGGQGQTDDSARLEAPLREGEMDVDGELTEDAWQRAYIYDLNLTNENSTTPVNGTLYLLHDNDTLFLALAATLPEVDDGDYVLVEFAGSSGGVSDSMRFEGGAPGTYTDGSGEGADDGTSGCGMDGDAARTTSVDVTMYELSKPFQGDSCDATFAVNESASMRITLHDVNEGTFMYPSGEEPSAAAGNGTGNESGSGSGNATGNDTSSDAPSGWASLTVLSASAASGGQVGDVSETPPTQGRRTQPDEGLETQAPLQPGANDETPPYDADEGTPGFGVLAALVAVGGTALAAAMLRRRST